MNFRRSINYKYAVGRKAENLIKQMMEELGFIVIPFGYEYILPNFANSKNLLKGEAGDFVRGQPDFFIVDKKTNYAYFIEVKYRLHGEINPDQIKDYPESWVILVEPGKISIAKTNFVKSKKRKDCFCNLNEIGPFKEKDKRIILKYVRETESFY
jgi:hypothetical protein